MARTWSATVAAMLALAAPRFVLAEETEPPKTPEKEPAALFQQLDANSDGQLTESEAGEEHQRLFKRLLRKADQDGDGKLSRAEFTAALTEERPKPPADAPDQGAGRFAQFLQANPEEIFERLDANGDGKIVLDELPEPARQGLGRFLEQADANRDKALTLEEFRKGHELARRLAGISPANAASSNAGPGAALFKALDGNGDGALSADELAAATESLKKLDRDGDGQLSPRELATTGGPPAGSRQDGNVRPNGNGRPGAEQLLARWKGFDKDDDGKLSADELPPLLKNRFDRVDSNGDGFADFDELRRAAEILAGQRGKRPGAGSDATPPKRPE